MSKPEATPQFFYMQTFFYYMAMDDIDDITLQQNFNKPMRKFRK